MRKEYKVRWSGWEERWDWRRESLDKQGGYGRIEPVWSVSSILPLSEGIGSVVKVLGISALKPFRGGKN